MINQINDYSSRLNILKSSSDLERLSKLDQNKKKQSKEEISIFQKEVINNLSGKVSSSDISFPKNIKEEIEDNPYKKKLYSASVEFESMFVKIMLNEMKNSVQKTNLIHGGYAEEIFDDMLYDEYAKNISKNESLGLAEQIYSTLVKNISDEKPE